MGWSRFLVTSLTLTASFQGVPLSLWSGDGKWNWRGELLGRVSSAPDGAGGGPWSFQPVAAAVTLLCAKVACPPQLTSQAWSPLWGTSSGWVFPAFSHPASVWDLWSVYQNNESRLQNNFSTNVYSVWRPGLQLFFFFCLFCRKYSNLKRF